jgi:hypothetical protein
MSIIKLKLTLFQVQIKSTFMNSSKLRKPPLWQGPKIFYTVNMFMLICKLILNMNNSVMFL